MGMGYIPERSYLSPHPVGSEDSMARMVAEGEAVGVSLATALALADSVGVGRGSSVISAVAVADS